MNSSILEDGDITVKLKDFNTASIILQDTVVLLKRKGGDEWKVGVVGSDPVQLKYSEEMTDTLIKYVILLLTSILFLLVQQMCTLGIYVLPKTSDGFNSITLSNNEVKSSYKLCQPSKVITH